MKLMEWHSLDKKRPDYDRKVLVMYEVENDDQTLTMTTQAITRNAEEYYKKFIEEDIANGNDHDLEVDRYLLSKLQDGTDDPLRFTIIDCDGDEMPDDVLPDEVLLWAYTFEETPGAHIFDALSFKRKFDYCILRLNTLGFKVSLKGYEYTHELPFNDMRILFVCPHEAMVDICNVVPLRGNWCLPESVNDHAHAAIMCKIENNDELEKAVNDLDTWIDGLEEHFHN